MKTLISCLMTCLLLLAAGCPQSNEGNKQADGVDTGMPAAETSGDATDQAAGTASDSAPADSNSESGALNLISRELKLGQRMQFSIPEERPAGGYMLRIQKLGQSADGKFSQSDVDSFEPVSGGDSSNGWLPQSTGKFVAILEDGSGNEIDREKFNVSAWPKGDPVQQLEPYVSINVGEVTEDMVLKVGLPIVAYWKVPDDFPHDSWIGLFKVDGNFEGSASADDAAESALLNGNKGQFTFFPKEPGRYVVRLFSSYEIAASHAGDSQQITVVEEYDEQ
ncbi:hypothetical protein KDL29_08745 [bacterium]|nr:hypothetical protein [bacterium]